MSIEGIKSQSIQANPLSPALEGAGATRQGRFTGLPKDEFISSKAPAAQSVRFSGSVGTDTVLDKTKNFFKYMAETKNRPVLKGLFYQYAVPSAVGALMLLGPIGWLFAIPGIPIAMMLAKRGETLVEKAVEEAQKKGLKGDPLKRFAKMGIIYETPTAKTAKEFSYEWNRVLSEILGKKKGTAAYQARKAASILPGSKRSQWLRAFLELKAKHLEKSGFITRGVRATISKLKVGPLKPIMVGLSVALNAVYLLFHQKAFKEILTRNLRKAV